MSSKKIAYLGQLYDVGGGGQSQTYSAGSHVSISPTNVISSDQADSMDYEDYEELTQTEKMDGTIRFLSNVPIEYTCNYQPSTETINYYYGATYISATETIKLD